MGMGGQGGNTSHLSWDSPADGAIYKTTPCTPRVLGSYFLALLSNPGAGALCIFLDGRDHTQFSNQG